MKFQLSLFTIDMSMVTTILFKYIKAELESLPTSCLVMIYLQLKEKMPTLEFYHGLHAQMRDLYATGTSDNILKALVIVTMFFLQVVEVDRLLECV
jgi:hypothetical protein